MNVVLKPAGLFVILVVIAVLAWLVVSDQAKLLFSPAGAPVTSDFKPMVPSGTAGSTPAAIVQANPIAPNLPRRVLDLSNMGPTDWMIYGARADVAPAQSAVRKAVDKPSIAPIEFLGTGKVERYDNDFRGFRYDDAAGPNPTGDDVRTGLTTSGVGSGFRVTLNPTLNKRQALKVWVGGSGVRSKVYARMSDGSPISKMVESYQNVGTTEKLEFRSLYTVYFRATKADQKLILSYIVADSSKNGASPAPGVSPTDGSVSLQAIGVN